MAQFGRPEADITAWASGTFADLDEASPSDAEFIASDSAPASDTAEYRFSDMEDPLASTGHLVRYRYRKDAAFGAQINLTVSLRQGAGTQIATWSHTDISADWSTAEQTLTAGEADAITDYADLRIRFVADQV